VCVFCSCLASCNGASVVTKFASDFVEDDFRSDVKEVSTRELNESVMIVSYDRGKMMMLLLFLCFCCF
jgi:hypothetical protein